MLLSILFFYLLAPPQETHLRPNTTTDLQKDGFVTYTSNGQDFKLDTLLRLPPDYIFLNYSYTIQGTSLVTWHRDVTSGQQYFGTRYPTYTAILYLCSGDLLTVSPGSHRTFPFSYGAPLIIRGGIGTMVLFNADLLHAGAPNKLGNDRIAVQFKIAHADDLPFLTHLQGIHARKIESNNMYGFKDMVRRWFSWKFSWITNTALYPFMQRRHGGVMGALQYIANMDFYNN
jgi:hypothetical protein